MTDSTRNFDSWLHALATSEDYWDAFGDHFAPAIRVDQGHEFLGHAIRLFRDPSVLSRFAPVDTEHLASSSANWLHHIIDSDQLDLALRTELVRETFSFFVQWYGSLGESSDACLGFWDTLIGTSFDLDTAIAAEIFHALERQLTVPNRFVQMSALNGFGRLEDSGCKPVIDLFQQQCSDPDVLRCAMYAKSLPGG